jgi:hypothetical protein
MSTFAIDLKSSQHRCGVPALPEDAKRSCPGLALASAITSRTFRAGSDGWIISM